MNPSECPDSTVWYNRDYGEATAGELRGEVAKAEPTMLELSAQMWSDIMNEDIRWRRDPRGVSLAESRALIESRYMREWADRVSASNGGTATASGRRELSSTSQVSRSQTRKRAATSP